jgi:flagellar biosynthesis component FlhA
MKNKKIRFAIAIFIIAIWAIPILGVIILVPKLGLIFAISLAMSITLLKFFIKTAKKA